MDGKMKQFEDTSKMRMRKLDRLGVYSIFDAPAEEWWPVWSANTDAHALRLAERQVRPEMRGEVHVYRVGYHNLVDGDLMPVDNPVIIPWPVKEVDNASNV